MSIRLLCDRCGAEDDIHTRRLDIEYVDLAPGRTMGIDPDRVLHLCGRCFRLLQAFLKDPER